MQSTRLGTLLQQRDAERKVSTQRDSAALRTSLARRARISGIGFSRGAKSGGQDQAAVQPEPAPQGARRGQRPPDPARGDIRNLLGLRPAVPRGAPSQGAGGDGNGPGAPSSLHGGMGPAEPAAEPPHRRAPPQPRPFRRGRTGAVPVPAGGDTRELPRPRAGEPPGLPPQVARGSREEHASDPEALMAGRTWGQAAPRGDAQRPIPPGVEGDAAHGSSPVLRGPDGRGSFLRPPPASYFGVEPARDGTDRRPAAGAAGSGRLTVLDMLGAAMPREPD